MVGIPPENLFYTVFVRPKAIVISFNTFNIQYCFLNRGISWCMWEDHLYGYAIVACVIH